ncbi:MAG: YceD family protein [Akkermansiaceae bacterium]
MKKHLTIDASALPEEGKSYSGELDPSVFDIPGDETRASGPLFYDLYLQRFDNELLVRGALSVPMEFTCVRTLQKFVQTIETPDWSTCIQLTGSEIDLTPQLREELAILFPDYPRCDQADDPMDCEVDSRYLAVDKPPEDVKTPPRDGKPDPWAALDALDDDSPAES